MQPNTSPGGTEPSPPALFRRYPGLAGHIPWVALGGCTTPVETLRLEGVEGGAWIKRDDLTCEPYGGNKVRKLEFLLAQAQRQGAGRVITAGAAGSHHALATTVYSRMLGLPATLVLFPQPLTPHVRQVLRLDHALGAELRFTPRMEMVPAALLAARLAHRRERPVVIPPGGSDAVGTLGYVSAALELAEQVEVGEAPRPDVVHVATGTMGTAAGLALGFALADLPIRVMAYRITGRIVTNEWALRRLLRSTLRRLRQAGLKIPPLVEVLRRIELRHEQLGERYGRETEAGRRATEQFAQAGLTLDPTYTAKAAAGFLAAVEADPEHIHLFWHTLSATYPRETAAAADLIPLPEPFRHYLAGESTEQ